MYQMRIWICLGVAALAAVALSVGAGAYSTFGKWMVQPVVVYANPSNADVSASAAETALKAALEVWNTQSGAAFTYAYGGKVKDTSTGYDGRNVIIFRNTSNGSAFASTYCWASGSSLVDCDIVFWDEAATFVTGTSGCSRAAYIEDIAAHELGHALGLGHSKVTEATMYPSYPWCSQELRTLDADDIAGVQALYGKAATSSKNTAPTVSISSPADGASFALGASITFAGSAIDTQDGDLTALLTWTSSLDGVIGAGGTFSRALSEGTHSITASVTDSGGLSGTSKVTITVTSSTTTVTSDSARLTARAYKVKGRQMADLAWSGLTASSIDVYRNGTRVAVTANTGTYTDAIGQKGGGSYTYRVCDAGTSTCSNFATATF
jgi:hypothetical protein